MIMVFEDGIKGIRRLINTYDQSNYDHRNDNHKKFFAGSHKEQGNNPSTDDIEEFKSYPYIREFRIIRYSKDGY